jgi:cation diffusion facilitator family transporter
MKQKEIPHTNSSTQFLSYLEGWLSIIINTLLFALKYWVGIMTRSVAIIADAWHTLSDSITSVVVIAGTKASSKPADSEHPFGHGRAELIASIIISVLLGVVGVNFIVEAVNKLIQGGKAEFDFFAIIVFLISGVIKEGIAIFSFWAAKQCHSNSLRADGWHHQSDAIASFVILIGIFLGKYFWWIDGVLGIIVALLIIYTAFDILKQGSSPLLGEKPGDELVQKINAIAREIDPSIIHIHHMHMHRYGNHTELSFHIRLSGRMQLEQAHNLATKLELAIKENLGIDATIHMEPITPKYNQKAR